MSKDDLLKMFELRQAGARREGAASASRRRTPAGRRRPVRPPPRTRSMVDEWGARRGRDLVAESQRLRDAKIDEVAAADFHAVAFDPCPELVESCTDKTRHEFLKQLLDTPEYRCSTRARTSTRRRRRSPPRRSPSSSRLAPEERQAASGQAEGQVRREGRQAGQDDGMAREMAVLRAVGKAVAEASKEVEELKEAEAALGMGAGSPGGPMDPKRVAELFRRVQQRPDPAADL